MNLGKGNEDEVIINIYKLIMCLITLILFSFI